MLRMQYGHAATLLMKYRLAEPTIEFPSQDAEHQRQLERVRDSLLCRPDGDGRGHGRHRAHDRREG
jgi:hypothetical protein